MEKRKIELSKFFQELKSSAIRHAQQCFAERKDSVKAVNASIGNVSLPLHPAMQKRLENLSQHPEFGQGIVKYTSTSGMDETKEAFKKVISLCGADTSDLDMVITSGGSQAIDLALLGCCQENRPLIISEPAYSNYISIAEAYKIPIVALPHKLNENGDFENLDDLESTIKKHNPGAIVVIPYDNPTGKLITQEKLNEIAKLCVKYDLWLISDEAYRLLHYTENESPSIWKVTENDVPGIAGRKIGIETVSKYLNGCGLRIGALISDNKEFIQKATIFASSHLCAGAIAQYIVGGIYDENEENLRKWIENLRNYYQNLLISTSNQLKKRIPNIIVSSPQSSLYLVADLENIVPKSFKISDFCQFCAEKGKIITKFGKFTLLFAPMENFYHSNPDFGRYQMRLSFVAPKEEIELIPELLDGLLKIYLKQN